MAKQQLIPVQYFCECYGVELAFLQQLHQEELIELVQEEENIFLDQNRLAEAEKLCRLHQELEINLQGLETINHLLQTIDYLQKENASLRNRLRFFEQPI